MFLAIPKAKFPSSFLTIIRMSLKTLPVLGLILFSPVMAQAVDFLYVSMSNSNIVARYDVSSGVQATIEASRVVYASGFGNPEGVALDSTGNLYVANSGGSTVSRVSPGGLSTDHNWATGLSQPRGLAVSAAGDLYIGNENSGTIQKVGPSGGTTSTFISSFGNSRGLAFDTTGNLYASNSGFGGATVAKISPGGSTIDGNWSSGYNYPYGVAIDSSGNVYTSSFFANIGKVGPAGGAASTFATGFSNPTGLAMGTSGLLYAADASLNSISVINSSGSILYSFTTGTDTPRGVAFQTVVPEPSTYMLAGIVSMTIGVLARRKKIRKG